MKLQRLLNLTRKAVEEYQMIQDGDRIAVGVSGGKDSLTLLYALAGLRKFYPHPFEIYAISVDLGYPGFDLSPVKELCERLAFTEAYTYAGIRSKVLGYSDVEGLALIPQLQKYVAGEISAEEALANAQSQGDSILAEAAQQ